jgi:signal transduction histidine kinase
MEALENLYERLRMLAAADPREARNVFLRSLDTGDPQLLGFLDRISSPGDGRLRQLVANAARNHRDRERLASHLLAWQHIETDEFTRRAIAGALEGFDLTTAKQTVSDAGTGISPTVEMYRYVSDRLRHRLRNAMMPAQVHVRRLRTLLEPQEGSDLGVMLDGISTAIVTLGREVEATDVDPAYFAQRLIVLQDWLNDMNTRYSMRYARVSLRLQPNNCAPICVSASDYLLEVIFWNIWLNAQQAVGLDCEITIQIRLTSGVLELLVADNGDGMPVDLEGIAFRQIYSTRQSSRGRGLLEVQEAIERLRGAASLVETSDGSCRIQLTLPVGMP